ncbi:YNFM family putative membrane transporter [Scopulibacillus daqui]|uniref:YNFM family putative membrane transporter n=1 Tax=Scopulibacillus daqui TaxID=1469162 RepID=A0ABS2PYX1_9BACL|nr:MFS transporter [Scopulibacillus daqui]MBM7645230.1 YNFM family putative membrane transporter [Scopulibacillus daqui]
MTYIERGTTQYWQANLALFFGGFVTFSILYTTQPLMPIFSKHFGISPSAASLSLSLTTGALALCMLLAAEASDAIGRKHIMIFSMALASIFTLVTAFSPNFAVLLILRGLLGIVAAGVPSIAMTYVNEEYHPKTLGHVMGLYVSGTSIGGMYGRIAVGAVTDFFSWQTAFIFIGITSLIISLLFWRLLPDSRHFVPKQVSVRSFFHSLGSQLKNPGILCIFGIGFSLMGGFVTMFNYIGYLLSEKPYSLSQSVIGSLFIVYMMGTVSSTWMGHMADTKGRAKVIIISAVIMLAGVLLTLFANLFIKIMGLAVFTFGFFGCHSVASGWVGDRVKENKSQASSLYLLFYYTGSSLIGTLGGCFWSRFGWGGIAGLISSLIVLSLVLTVISYAFEKKEAKRHDCYRQAQ